MSETSPPPDPFLYHQISESCSQELNAIRAEFIRLRDTLVRIIPNSRERSIALRHLQTGLMFAIQAHVLYHPDSKPQAPT